MSSNIGKSDFQAALNRLEAMAKGQGQTQLFATPSDSNPGTWAGSSQTDVDEHTDGIDENGTDYTGVKKALAAKVAKSKALTPAEVAIVKGEDPRPIIGQKISKGKKLTAAERWVLKGGAKFFKKNDEEEEEGEEEEPKAEKGKKIAKASTKPEEAPASGTQDDAGKVPGSNAGANIDDEIETDAKKSLGKSIGETQSLRKGIEMSPILYEFARAMGEALEGVEARTAQRISKAIEALTTKITTVEKSMVEQGEFNKGFAETLVGIGQHVAGSTAQAAQAATEPAGAPKSHLRALPGGVQPIQKSFGPGGLDINEGALAKSQVVDVMTDLVQKGKLSSLDVVKYETTGQISPQVQQMVLAQAQGGLK